VANDFRTRKRFATLWQASFEALEGQKTLWQTIFEAGIGLPHCSKQSATPEGEKKHCGKRSATSGNEKYLCGKRVSEPERVCHIVAGVPRCVGAVRASSARAPRATGGTGRFAAGAPGIVWIYNKLYAKVSPVETAERRASLRASRATHNGTERMNLPRPKRGKSVKRNCK
jgi:hypothetical protein